MNNTTIESEDRRVKASDAIRELAEKNSGTLTPELVLDAAKSKRSPLHSFFCWDNTEAANQYRLIQAAQLIRRIRVTYHPTEDRSVKVRAFVNVVEPDDHPEPSDIEGHGVNARPRGIYVGFEQAISVESYREQLLRQCKRDAETFRSKYSAVSEAAKIIEAMDKFTSQLTIE